jgi:hypothetical protein
MNSSRLGLSSAVHGLSVAGVTKRIGTSGADGGPGADGKSSVQAASTARLPGSLEGNAGSIECACLAPAP